jgi:hypothetical protein
MYILIKLETPQTNALITSTTQNSVGQETETNKAL